MERCCETRQHEIGYAADVLPKADIIAHFLSRLALLRRPYGNFAVLLLRGHAAASSHIELSWACNP